MLNVGDKLPSFELKNQNGEAVSNSTLSGEKTLIVFVPFAFSSVCSGEVCELDSKMSELSSLDANAVVISVDSSFANAAWAKAEGVQVPVLSDNWPHGEVSKAFGNFNEEHGCANRTTFVADESGVITEVIPAESLGEARAYESYTAALSEG